MSTAGTERPALVVLDMQNDVVMHRNPAIRQHIAASGVVSRCADAITLAHDAGIPVIVVTVERRANGSDRVTNLTDAAARQSAPPPETCIEGTEGAALVDGLPVRDGDIRVTKRRRGAFAGTDLEQVLRFRHVTTLVLAGVSTTSSVEGSAREAFDRGYDVVVLSDCCCAFSREEHDWSLSRIIPGIGRVMSLASASAWLEGLARR